MGYDALAAIVAPYPPDKVAEICGVPAEAIRRTADIFGTSDRVLSTVLQGFYQSQLADGQVGRRLGALDGGRVDDRGTC